MKRRRSAPAQGFTLIEIVLAVIVIGVLTAVIIPRAMRANVEVKYAAVRQTAKEIAHWGMEWSRRNLENQTYNATCSLNAYTRTLIGYVGSTETTNWIVVNDDLSGSEGCRPVNNGLTASVADIVPGEASPRNPFNGLSYFNIRGGNDDDEVQPGLLYLVGHKEGDMTHYYLVYTGTDSETVDDWHAGMGQGEDPNLPQLRNGIFMARLNHRTSD